MGEQQLTQGVEIMNEVLIGGKLNMELKQKKYRGATHICETHEDVQEAEKGLGTLYQALHAAASTRNCRTFNLEGAIGAMTLWETGVQTIASVLWGDSGVSCPKGLALVLHHCLETQLPQHLLNHPGMSHCSHKC